MRGLSYKGDFMNKKGFISTALVYSFFLVFIAIILSVIIAYSSRRIMLSHIKDDTRKNIGNANNNCFSKGISLLNECILDSHGGADAIDSLNNTVFESVSTDDNSGLFKTEDNDGTSYYYRGNVQNNYVKFGKWLQNASFVRGYYSNNSTSYKTYSSIDECEAAVSYNKNCQKFSIANIDDDMYWRIIRINGDGTIRLIYDGTQAVANGINRNESIGISKFNDRSAYDAHGDINAYVQYTYKDYYNIARSSMIKVALDNWFLNNLADSSNIASGNFCNAQQIINTVNGTNYFEVWDRLYTNKKPNLKCEYGLYQLSIGTITADEVAFAGGVSRLSNYNYYLYSGRSYWTLSPAGAGGTDYTGHVWYVDGTGGLNNMYTSSEHNIRPVINLKSDTKIKSGNGTMNSPFVIEEVE